MPKYQLADIAEVSYGRPVSRYERSTSSEEDVPKRRRKNTPEPTYEMARILNVTALATWPDSLKGLNTSEMDTSRTEFFAHAGDVIVALSSPFPAVCIREEDVADAPLFIPNSCAVVRCSEKLDPWYLTGYFGLDVVKSEVLPGQSRGDRTVLLSAKQLSEATIDVPPLEAQKALAKLVQEKEELETARRRADAADRALIEAVFSRAITGVHETEEVKGADA